jgi:predicted ArsR family transcriptional regulator
MSNGNKVGLTSLGKRKAENVGESIGLRYSIITYIEDKGVSSVAEIADGVNVHPLEVRRKIKQLVNEGWLLYTDDLGDDDWD